MRRKQHLTLACAALLALICQVSAVVAQDAEFFGESAAAIFPVDNEKRIEISGFTGEISVRAGKAGELRYMSVSLEDRKDEIPAELWRDGRTLQLVPAESGRERPVLLEISVPPGIDVELSTAGGVLTASGLSGDLQVVGSDVDFQARGLNGSLGLELLGGSARINGVLGDVSLKLEEADGFLVNPEGELSGGFAGSTFEIRGARSDVRLYAEQTELVVREVSGTFNLQASDGQAEVSGLHDGGEFRLTGTVLTLAGCKGNIDIETDETVQFDENEASMHINSWGGAVRGSGNKGMVEVKTDSADVVMKVIDGPVRVQGDGLNVQLERISGELLVMATSSRIDISEALMPVTIENEFGDITVNGATRDVSVISRDGNVRLGGLMAAAQVSAEGEQVVVGWTSLKNSENSRVSNASGGVVVVLPSQGGCRVEARTRYGRIETEIPEIRINDEGNRASGVINNRSRPTVTIEAEDDIRLLPAGAEAGEED